MKRSVKKTTKTTTTKTAGKTEKVRSAKNDNAEFLQDLSTLGDLGEKELSDLANEKAANITQLYSEKYENTKVATHVTIGHTSKQGLDDSTNIIHDPAKDYTLMYVAQDEKFFIEVVIVLFPLKEPIQLDKEDQDHLAQ